MRQRQKRIVAAILFLWLAVNAYGCFRTNKVVYSHSNDHNSLIDSFIQYRWGTLLASSLVLSGGARENIQSYLNLAAACDNLQAMRILRFFGADFGKGADNRNTTALHEAAAFASRDSIKMLIDAGVDPDIRDDYGLTPLHHLAKSGPGNVRYWNLVRTVLTTKQVSYEVNCATMDILISRGADVSARTDRGETPIFYAAKHKKKYYVKRLLEAGADLNAVNQAGETPLDWAITHADEPFNQYSYVAILEAFDTFPGIDKVSETLEEHQTEKFLQWLREQGALTGEELRALAEAERIADAAP